MGRRRAVRLRGLADRTFDLPYAKLRESTARLSELVSSRREEILQLARKYGASNVRIFGSAARREGTTTSDIDLLVDLEGDKDTLLRVAGLTEELSDLLGVKVDVATVQLLREEIRDEALATAVPL